MRVLYSVKNARFGLTFRPANSASLLSLRLFHRPFPKLFLAGDGLISRIDRPGETIMEGGLEGRTEV
jgi:hypothetical protein